METLSLDKVEFIISMAREVGESSPAIIDEELAEDSLPHHYSELTIAAQAETSASEDFGNDSAYQELKSVINGLNVEERNELVALMWIGRGTFAKNEWKAALSQAQEADNDHTAEYMMGAPLLPDYLTEGLAMMTQD